MVVITRDNMSPGYQLVQSVHALANFAAEHPRVFREWQGGSNTLVCLSVADEPDLTKLLETLGAYETPLTVFREADVNHQLTAFCILGTDLIRSKLRHVRPALRGNKRQSIRDMTTDSRDVRLPIH